MNDLINNLARRAYIGGSTGINKPENIDWDNAGEDCQRYHVQAVKAVLDYMIDRKMTIFSRI